MSQVLITESNLTNIANAIRSKNGSSDTYTPAEMATAISNIPSGGSGGEPILGAIRSDAELVWSNVEDAMAFADMGLTKPNYTTSNQNLRTATQLTTYQLDLENYNYCVVMRGLILPEYSITTKAKGREDYGLVCSFSEIAGCFANSIKSRDGTATFASSAATVLTSSVLHEIYWTSGTAIGNSTTGYGINFNTSSPTYTSGSITIKCLPIVMRGHATYFTQTYWDALTDARVQIFQGLYRAPNTSSVKGWSATSQRYHILKCIDTGDNF